MRIGWMYFNGDLVAFTGIIGGSDEYLQSVSCQEAQIQTNLHVAATSTIT